MSDLTTAVDVQTPSAARTSMAARNIRLEAKRSDRDPGGHNRRRRIIEITLGIVFPLALLGLWQLASSQGWIDRFQFPSPTTILSEIKKSFRDNPKGNWWTDVWWSAQRMLWGFLWGVLIGLVFGFVMGMSRWIRATLEPTLNALYTVPKIALISVFLIIFGFDNKPVIVIIAITVFFFVWIQTMAAVILVSEGFREAARSFGANRWQMFRHVILPASLPQIFVGLRVAGGVAVLTLIGVEFVFAPGPRGIGYRIANARQTLDPKQAYVGLVVAALFGVLFTWVIKRIGKLAVPWARDEIG